MKSSLKPIGTLLGITGAAGLLFLLIRGFGLSPKETDTGLSPTPTLQLQTVPTSLAQWNVQRIEVVSVNDVPSARALLTKQGTQLLEPKFSPNGEHILWIRYTGELFPCTEGDKTCFRPVAALVIYSKDSQSWTTLHRNAVEGNWSPNGNAIAYLSQKKSGQYDLEWIDVKTQTSVTLDKDVAFTAPFWQSDNKVIFADRLGNIKSVGLSGKISRPLTEIRAARRVPGPGSFALSPSGDSLAVVSGSDVWLIAFGNNPSQVKLVPPGEYLQYSNQIYGLRWSPGGHYLALIASDSSILIYDRRGQLQKQLPSQGERVTSMAWSPNERAIVTTGQIRTDTESKYFVTLMDSADGSIKRITESASRKHTIDWSPVGRIIAVGQDDQKLPLVAEIRLR